MTADWQTLLLNWHPVFRGLDCPFSEYLMKNALHEITANSQG